MADKFYAWGTIYNGGESQEAKDGRRLIVKRNIIEPGTEVTKAKLGMSDEEWDEKVEGGSIRPYPLPKNMEEGESPSDAVLRGLRAGKEEIPQDKLLELALSHPAPVTAFSEEAEAEVPKGA